MQFVVATITFLALMAASIANSGERAKRVGQVQDWSVFKHLVNGEPLCWIVTTPLATSGDLSKRSVFVMYTLGKYQLSVTSTSAKFPSPSGKLKVGRTNYPMFFRGNSGWMRGRDDSLVIEAILLNRRAGVNSGNSGFAFSLNGFEEAAERAAEHCEIPPFTWSERETN